MIEFKKTEIKANIYGTVYELRRPTVAESQDYGKVANEKDDEKATEHLLELLAKCGLPKEIAREMEADHLVSLIESLMPKKK